MEKSNMLRRTLTLRRSKTLRGSNGSIKGSALGSPKSPQKASSGVSVNEDMQAFINGERDNTQELADRVLESIEQEDVRASI